MGCSCISNEDFNFVIEYDKDHITIIDKSTWATEEHNAPLIYHNVEIINNDKTYTFPLKINGSTIIKYCDLPSESSCGSDGIYTFKIDNCGLIYRKTVAILKHINCSYSKLLINTELKDYKNVIWPIFRQIEFIKVNAVLGYVKKAEEHYNLLVDMLKQINCEC